MGHLDGQIALVTGAARMRGIGRAIAEQLARDGADVVICGRESTRLPEYEAEAGWRGLESVAEGIRGLGRRALALTCDVAVETDVAAAFDRAISELGVPTIIVNNAAAPSERGQIALVDLEMSRWQRTIDVNLTGAFLVARTGAAHMLRAGLGGSIINIGSTTGRVPIPNFGAYCVAKFGLIGLTQQLSQELAGASIRVNCVCPGTTDTDLMASAQKQAERDPGGEVAQMLAAVKSTIPMRRVSAPAEQAAVVSFLASHAASYITGQSINVDGGTRMD